MERDYGKEIDLLREELAALRALLTDARAAEPPEPREASVPGEARVGHVQKMRGMIPDPAGAAILDRLENVCGETGDSGRITYLGVFASGGRQSTWWQNEVGVDSLLTLIEDRTVERVLACIGNEARLRILLALLKKPMTVASLVEACGFGSTGQAYHHLKPLIAADLVAEDDENEVKGVYVIQPHRVQGLIMLLAGIRDMIDGEYSEGTWENE